MQQVQMGDLRLWQFDSLQKISSLKHFVSARNTAPGQQEFTLSLSSTPDKDAVLQNRSVLASVLGIPAERLFFPSQVHGTRLVRVSSQTQRSELMDADALITNEKGVCIAVLSADCVTILLYDQRKGAAGAVHAGWRGTVAKILEKTLHEMKHNFGTRGEDLLACIGPSVCQEVYEVGEEVVWAVKEAFGNTGSLLTSLPNNKAKLDLWQANKLQLLAFGVPEAQIELPDLCTFKNNDAFFSARKGDAGRFAAGIMLV